MHDKKELNEKKEVSDQETNADNKEVHERKDAKKELLEKKDTHEKKDTEKYFSKHDTKSGSNLICEAKKTNLKSSSLSAIKRKDKSLKFEKDYKFKDKNKENKNKDREEKHKEDKTKDSRHSKTKEDKHKEDKQKEDKQKEDKQKEDKQKEDKQKEDKQKEDRQKGDKQKGDKQKGDKQKEDKQKEDKQKEDKPKEEKMKLKDDESVVSEGVDARSEEKIKKKSKSGVQSPNSSNEEDSAVESTDNRGTKGKENVGHKKSAKDLCIRMKKKEEKKLRVGTTKKSTKGKDKKLSNSKNKNSSGIKKKKSSNSSGRRFDEGKESRESRELAELLKSIPVDHGVKSLSMYDSIKSRSCKKVEPRYQDCDECYSEDSETSAASGGDPPSAASKPVKQKKMTNRKKEVLDDSSSGEEHKCSNKLAVKRLPNKRGRPALSSKKQPAKSKLNETLSSSDTGSSSLDSSDTDSSTPSGPRRVHIPGKKPMLKEQLKKPVLASTPLSKVDKPKATIYTSSSNTESEIDQNDQKNEKKPVVDKSKIQPKDTIANREAPDQKPDSVATKSQSLDNAKKTPQPFQHLLNAIGLHKNDVYRSKDEKPPKKKENKPGISEAAIIKQTELEVESRGDDSIEKRGLALLTTSKYTSKYKPSIDAEKKAKVKLEKKRLEVEKKDGENIFEKLHDNNSLPRKDVAKLSAVEAQCAKSEPNKEPSFLSSKSVKSEPLDEGETLKATVLLDEIMDKNGNNALEPTLTKESGNVKISDNIHEQPPDLTTESEANRLKASEFPKSKPAFKSSFNPVENPTAPAQMKHAIPPAGSQPFAAKDHCESMSSSHIAEDLKKAGLDIDTGFKNQSPRNAGKAVVTYEDDLINLCIEKRLSTKKTINEENSAQVKVENQTPSLLSPMFKPLQEAKPPVAAPTFTMRPAETGTLPGFKPISNQVEFGGPANIASSHPSFKPTFKTFIPYERSAVPKASFVMTPTTGITSWPSASSGGVSLSDANKKPHEPVQCKPSSHIKPSTFDLKSSASSTFSATVTSAVVPLTHSVTATESEQPKTPSEYSRFGKTVADTIGSNALPRMSNVNYEIKSFSSLAPSETVTSVQKSDLPSVFPVKKSDAIVTPVSTAASKLFSIIEGTTVTSGEVTTSIDSICKTSVHSAASSMLDSTISSLVSQGQSAVGAKLKSTPKIEEGTSVEYSKVAPKTEKKNMEEKGKDILACQLDDTAKGNFHSKTLACTSETSETERKNSVTDEVNSNVLQEDLSKEQEVKDDDDSDGEKLIINVNDMTPTRNKRKGAARGGCLSRGTNEPTKSPSTRSRSRNEASSPVVPATRGGRRTTRSTAVDETSARTLRSRKRGIAEEEEGEYEDEDQKMKGKTRATKRKLPLKSEEPEASAAAATTTTTPTATTATTTMAESTTEEEKKEDAAMQTRGRRGKNLRKIVNQNKNATFLPVTDETQAKVVDKPVIKLDKPADTEKKPGGGKDLYEWEDDDSEAAPLLIRSGATKRKQLPSPRNDDVDKKTRLEVKSPEKVRSDVKSPEKNLLDVDDPEATASEQETNEDTPTFSNIPCEEGAKGVDTFNSVDRIIEKVIRGDYDESPCTSLPNTDTNAFKKQNRKLPTRPPATSSSSSAQRAPSTLSPTVPLSLITSSAVTSMEPIATSCTGLTTSDSILGIQTQRIFHAQSPHPPLDKHDQLLQAAAGQKIYEKEPAESTGGVVTREVSTGQIIEKVVNPSVNRSIPLQVSPSQQIPSISPHPQISPASQSSPRPLIPQHYPQAAGNPQIPSGVMVSQSIGASTTPSMQSSELRAVLQQPPLLIQQQQQQQSKDSSVSRQRYGYLPSDASMPRVSHVRGEPIAATGLDAGQSPRPTTPFQGDLPPSGNKQQGAYAPPHVYQNERMPLQHNYPGTYTPMHHPTPRVLMQSSDPWIISPAAAPPTNRPPSRPPSGQPSPQGLMPAGSSMYPSPGLPHMMPLETSPDCYSNMLQRYPIMWSGNLALKNESSAAQMHFVSGSKKLVKEALPTYSEEGLTLPLRISQRMRLEIQQLDGVCKRMTKEDQYSMLLAIPYGRDHLDIVESTNSLKTGFIQYLQKKQAAGIVNVAGQNSEQPAFVVHIFPPCEFSQTMLSRLAPDLLHSVAELAHLMIIIATV